MRLAAAVVLFGLVAPAAASAQDGAVQGALARYDFSQRSGRMELSDPLTEVSGLALGPDGGLYAHADERAWVHRFDLDGPVETQRFMLGDQTARDDFEGIAFVGDRLFMVSSRGLLYESRSGADREEMPYRMTDLGLSGRCEAEGLEYLAARDELLVACKTAIPDGAHIIIHRVPISIDAARPDPIRVSRDRLDEEGLPRKFRPSGIAWDAEAGTLLIVSGRDEALIEISMDGELIGGVELSRNRHPQTEGIVVGPDGTLWLADEANGRPPRLTWYRPTTWGSR